jgi:5-methylcytosine-specific restriction endonuclease McrA
MGMIEHVSPDCTCPGKFCPKCEQTRCYKAFYSKAKAKDGLRSECKQCEIARSTAWNAAHKGEREIYRKNYYEEHREQELTQVKAYQRSHIEQVRSYARAYGQNSYAASPGKFKARSKTYYRRNTTKVRARVSRYYAAHCLTIKVRVHAYRQSDLHKSGRKRRERQNPTLYKDFKLVGTANRRMRKRQAGGLLSTGQWKQLKAHYAFTCLCCGKQEPDIKLSADHVIPLAKGGSNDISNIQPLCTVCNARKHTAIIDYRPNWQERSFHNVSV